MKPLAGTWRVVHEVAAPAPAAPAAAPAAAEARASIVDHTAMLRERVLKQVDAAAAAELSAPALRRQLEDVVHQIATDERLEISAREQARIAEEMANDMAGYGPLEPLLRDDAITDIMVNGPNRVFVERAGKLQLTDVRFRDNDHVATVAQKIAAQVGRRIDESSPMVDARLTDGSRVNVIFPPLALDGPCLSIRKFARRRLDLNGLVANGSMSAPIARLLGIAARCRLNIIVSGGTGSGKTTMLNALSRLIAEDERIVTIEDAAELQLQQPHVVRLETRPANAEGIGEVTQRELVRNALRMRPDRIIIGEVRGAEAFDMLQAMNTGHDGSMSTIHANTTREALTRIENMVQMGNMGLPSRAIRTQIVGAVDLIVQVERQRDGGRRLTQVTEICGMEADVVAMNDVFQLEIEGQRADGQLYGRYKVNPVPPGFMRRLAYFGLDTVWADAVHEAMA